MHALWVILACLAGTFTFGFLLTGFLSCADLDGLESTNRENGFRILSDAVFFGSFGFLTSGIAKNWSKHRDARRMVYTGLISLAALVIFLAFALLSRA
jgi:uncharacterized PurR-regulated membrane protein YhhQ (DUF165 family)